MTTSYYIRKIIRQLQIYIIHCSKCQLNRIIRHSSYDAFQSIQFAEIISRARLTRINLTRTSLSSVFDYCI